MCLIEGVLTRWSLDEVKLKTEFVHYFKTTFLSPLLYGAHDKVSPSNIIKKQFLCI